MDETANIETLQNGALGLAITAVALALLAFMLVRNWARNDRKTMLRWLWRGLMSDRFATTFVLMFFIFSAVSAGASMTMHRVAKTMILQQEGPGDQVRLSDISGPYTHGPVGEVPEPATCLLLGLGSIIVVRRRRPTVRTRATIVRDLSARTT